MITKINIFFFQDLIAFFKYYFIQFQSPLFTLSVLTNVRVALAELL